MPRNPVRRWLRRHDPQGGIGHRAIRAAVVVTVALGIGDLWIGVAELTTFAVFGCFALLLFVDFPGSRAARLTAYALLAGVGAVLITVGTLMSSPGWLAVIGMAVFGFAIFFAGILSASTAAATRAALLTFVLPVCVPGDATSVLPRLGGWGIAVALSIPAAMLWWPPTQHDRLREAASRACTALGGAVAGLVPAERVGAPVEVSGAITTLRREFRATVSRPVGLTAGTRLLVRLIDQLDWVRAAESQAASTATADLDDTSKTLIGCCAKVLTSAGDVLRRQPSDVTAAARDHLARVIAALEVAREKSATDQVDLFLGAERPGPVTPQHTAEYLSGPQQLHEIAYATDIVGHTVALASAADNRPVLSRILGRPTPDPLPVVSPTTSAEVSQSVVGAAAAGRRLVAVHASLRSVWLQNSLRGGLGLAIAVAAVELTDVQHGFWVVLGAMSILRSTAMNTSATALRAVAGTTLGFAVGGGLVLAVGTSPVALWVLLPIAVAIAGFVPEAVSFAAGQAAFTVTVVVLFNIIDPVGWQVGLIRIEDVLIGAATGVVVGVLLWPRGAAAQIRRSLAEAYRASGAALLAVTQAASGPPSAELSVLEHSLLEAKATTERLDDAFRQYFSDRGEKSARLAEITAAVNGANRVRLSAEAIAALGRSPGIAGEDDVSAILVDAAGDAERWMLLAAAVLIGSSFAPPPPRRVNAEALTTPHLLGVNAFRARRWWTTALYLDDVGRLQNRLIKPLSTLVGPVGEAAPQMKGVNTPSGS